MAAKATPHNAQLIAAYFLTQSKKENKPITNKKLQKLLYYAQAWHLAFHDKKLFKEDIEAWIHGPAVRSIYGLYKKFGFACIDVPTFSNDIFKKLTSEQVELLQEIWRVYGKYDADYLEQLTHSESPWIKARDGIEPTVSSHNIISEDEMKDFYKALFSKHTKK